MGTKNKTAKLLSDEETHAVLSAESKIRSRGIAVLIALQVILTVIISALSISKGGTHIPYEIIGAAIASFIIVMVLLVAALLLSPVYIPIIQTVLYIRDIVIKKEK